MPGDMKVSILMKFVIIIVRFKGMVINILTVIIIIQNFMYSGMMTYLVNFYVIIAFFLSGYGDLFKMCVTYNIFRKIRKNLNKLSKSFM